MISRNSEAIEKPRWLNGWINIIHMVRDMQDKGLKVIQRAIFNNTLDVNYLESGLLAAIYHQLSREILTEKPHLMHYSAVQFSAKQERFHECNKRLQFLQRQRIVSVIGNQKIIQGVSGGLKSEYTELSLIRSELGKKTRNIPIRQLISRAKNSLLQLKPCFMMSPMSVAYYLEPKDISFDLVIMDESSQIKPEDALGVIARGKQLVVVGDPKQLPPTRFFDYDSDQESYDEEVAAVSQTESILDALLPLFPMRRLQWHYRSLNENLIACSNYYFYDNSLIVFPSPFTNMERYGIGFTHVKNGVFVDQGNHEEARIIALAVKDHALQYPEESLGVIAMNTKQRYLIESAINKLCRKDSEVGNAISRLRMHADPFFIKNLENVQGDERDRIFISFTYGPNEVGGRVFQRFGPIFGCWMEAS
ncbi:DEAD/DEAH box helicase [Candidatus Liberibacter africanus]|uniref:DEAD/DEAH box helicase n=1 Tax=Liberibacter africanus TaxID=34020 RepID=UPI00339D4DCA